MKKSTIFRIFNVIFFVVMLFCLIDLFKFIYAGAFTGFVISARYLADQGNTKLLELLPTLAKIQTINLIVLMVAIVGYFVFELLSKYAKKKEIYKELFGDKEVKITKTLNDLPVTLVGYERSVTLERNNFKDIKEIHEALLGEDLTNDY